MTHLLRALLACLFAVPASNALAAASDTEAFEARLDETIRSACHGYLVDALPESLSWLRERIEADSPLCQRVRALPEDAPTGSLLASGGRTGPDLGPRIDRDINEDIACEGDWMCVHIRTRFRDGSDPVGQDAYARVARHCDGAYGCIEDFFSRWPAPLPDPRPEPAPEAYTGLRFSELLGTGPAAQDGPPAERGRSGPGASATTAPGPPAAATASDGSAPPSIGLDSITRARQAQSDARAKAALDEDNSRLARTCDCSLAGRACWENPYGPIRAHLTRLDAKRRALCEAWQTNLGGLDETSDLDEMRGILRALDRNAEKVITLARNDFDRMRREATAGRRPALSDYLTHVERLVREIENRHALMRPSPRVVAAAEAPSSSIGAPTPLELRLSFDDARAHCRQQGLRLPTPDESRAHVGRLRPDFELGGRPQYSWGIWTNEDAYRDAYVHQVRTRRFNGDLQAIRAHQAQYVVCVP